MQSKFAHTLSLVRANDGFPGLGFKRAAAEANAERTMMRFALEAYRRPQLAAAIEGGIITDPKVIQLFHRLPALGADIVCRLETRLGRPLSRNRADRLVRAYLKVTGQENLPRPAVRAAVPAEESMSRQRNFRLPTLPAFF